MMKSILFFFVFSVLFRPAFSQDERTLLGNWKEGYGIYLYTNNAIYEGYWQNGKRNGIGRYYFSDGQGYEGRFVNDIKLGPGTYRWSTSRFSGYWNDQTRHGQGEYVWNDGSKKTGYWKNDQFLSQDRPVYRIRKDGKGSFAKIQDAIDAAIPGSEIVVEEGDYDEQLIIKNKMALSLRGEGDVWLKVPTDDIIGIYNSDDITLINIKGIHTNRDEMYGCSTSDVLEIGNCSSIRIIHCTLDGCGQIGLNAYSVNNLFVTNSTIQNCIFSGISLSQCSEVIIRNNLIVNQHIESEDNPYGTGIELYACANVQIQNNTIADNLNNVPLSLSGEKTSAQIERNIIAFNILRGEHASVVRTENVSSERILILNNIIYDNRLLGNAIGLGSVKNTGTLSVDPQFSNAANRDYLLRSGSPAALQNIGANFILPESKKDPILLSPSVKHPAFVENGLIPLAGYDTTIIVHWPNDGWVFVNGRLMLNQSNGEWKGIIKETEIGCVIINAIRSDGQSVNQIFGVKYSTLPVQLPQGDNAAELITQGIRLNDSNLFKQALPYFTQAARIDWVNPDAYALRAWSLANLNDKEKARAYSDFSIKLNYSPGLFFIKGYCELLFGNADSARAAFAQGLKIVTRTAQYDELMNVLKSEFIDKNQRVKEARELTSWAADFYAKNGKAFTSALEPLFTPSNDSAYEAIIDQLLDRLKKHPNLPDEFRNSFWYDMATYFLYYGDYTKGLRCLALSDERFHTDARSDAITRVRNAALYSSIYDALGDFQKQSWSLQQALKLSEKMPTQFPTIGILNSLASAESFLNKKTAFDYVKQSRALAEKTGSSYHIADAYVRTCMVFMNFSHANDAEAAQFAEKALAIARENKLSYSMNGAISNLAINYFRNGQRAKGIRLYDEAIALAKSDGRLRDAELYLNNVGSMLFWNQDYETAAKYFSEAVGITENLRRGMSGDERKLYFANVVSAYHFLSMSYARLGKGKELFEALESFKARTLAEKLTGNDSAKTISLREAQSLLEPDEALISYMLSYSALDIIVSVVTREQAVALYTTRTNLFDGIKTKYGSELKLVAENKRGMKPKQAITQDKPSETYSSTGFIFDEMIELYRRSLQSGQNEILQNELGRLFYSALIEPALPYLNGKTRLLIVPENTLGYLPFETLKNPSGTYLVENYSIRYTQSMSVYAIVNARSYPSGRSTILAVGNPLYESSDQIYPQNYNSSSFDDFIKLEREIEKRLTGNEPLQPAYAKMGVTSWNTLPGTAFEISEIKKMIPAAEIMAQSDANEKKIKDFSASGALQNYRIIHFAAHGVVLPALPSLSAVVLSQINNPANSEDGYLTMKEIAKLKLRSDLVNLSACETGLGKLYGGEGVVGLTQAFQQAGANALSVSLWSVADESTAKFMTGFYNLSLLQNISFSVAATEIKRKFIKGEFGETYKKPFYWAPFVYYGK